MDIYRGFNYHVEKDYYKFLTHYPEKITNYNLAPFGGVYARIEEEVERGNGLAVKSENPVNTGSLLVPIALKLGGNYANMSIVSAIDRNSIGAYIDKLNSLDTLVLDEVGGEHGSLSWVLPKIIDYRYAEGLTTYFGLSFSSINKFTERYDQRVYAKFRAMCSFVVDIKDRELFVTAKDSSYKVDILEKA